MDSMVWLTALVSGTFSSSTTVTPGTPRRMSIAAAWDWFQP
jgi:hypothetical protein